MLTILDFLLVHFYDLFAGFQKMELYQMMRAVVKMRINTKIASLMIQ